MTTQLYKSRIAGTGSYLPEKILTNSDLEKLVVTSDQWITERTGIKERRMASDTQATSDLGLIAAQKALESAGITAQEIDFIIFATVTPDYVMPSTACLLQAKLGARNVGAVDVSAACSGFIYALSMADLFIKTGVYKNILVVGAEVIHRIVNYEDRDTCILFGDGAGAFVVTRAQADDPSQVFSFNLRANGELGHLFELPGGGSVNPLSQKVLDGKMQYVRMKGREIFKHAVRTMVACCDEALRDASSTVQDIDWLIPHQANIRILEAVASHFEYPLEKVVVNIQKTGNTSAATIPVAFDEAVRDGRIQRGQKIMLTAFGAGITSGSLFLRY